MPKNQLAVLLALLAISLASCSSEDAGDVASDPAPTQDTSSAAPADEPGVACEYVADGSEPAKPVEAPPAEASATGTLTVTIATSEGDLTAELDADATPCTVNSFLSLAKQGYFDDTDCHRLTTAGILVLQCGDPTASGRGGPGYSFADELTGAETYGPGTLAMANAGPNTNGSQFFVVYGDSQLSPAYTVFGHIDDASVATVQAIADAGTDDANGPGDGHPKTPVTITGVTLN
jgi:peptidyl-prolyl cis-trans isomerase B (cyclophilin B)